MKTCPACRKAIDERATICPYCRTTFTLQQMNAGRDQNRRRYVGVALALIFGIFVLIRWLNNGGVETLARM